MSIISKLKGDKKADNEKKDGVDHKQSGQGEPRPANTSRKSWSVDDMRQINRTAERFDMSKARSYSPSSSRPSNHRMSRSASNLSQEWVPSQSKSASAPKYQSRSSSFHGLEKVLEDGNDRMSGVPPVPAMPSRYSSASSASSSKPTIQRSPYSARSSIGKSPLSTTETTPVDSEESSNTSTCSYDILEMRSHPFSHPDQFVFGVDQGEMITRNDSKGKGKAPMYPSYADHESPREHENRAFEPIPERKYFTRAHLSGTTAPQVADTPSTATTAEATPKSPKKKGRFGLFKKGDSTT